MKEPSKHSRNDRALAVLGAGLAGCTAALELAAAGRDVILIDKAPRPMLGASRHNEGKLHLGYVYAADRGGKTHALMAEGSLQFPGIVERLTGIPWRHQVVSDAFTYIMPEDSALPEAAIWAHAQRVDATAAELCAAFDLPALPPSAAIPRQQLHLNYSSRVMAGFATPEIAVDPGRVSDLVSAAVYAHPQITFRGGCRVLAAAPRPGGGYGVTLQEGETQSELAVAGIVNALWEDRTRLDAMIGLPVPAGWSQRWKATVMIDVPPGSVPLPSTTAIVGPYGDVVLYGDRRFYVSWYPVCRLSLSTSLSPEEAMAIVDKADPEALRQDAIAGVSSLLPGAAVLADHARTTRIGGGFIMAVGDTDIDQSGSGLHERHQIGVECKDAWVSLSTGKFCTAPMFGVRAARALAERVPA